MRLPFDEYKAAEKVSGRRAAKRSFLASLFTGIAIVLFALAIIFVLKEWKNA